MWYYLYYTSCLFLHLHCYLIVSLSGLTGFSAPVLSRFWASLLHQTGNFSLQFVKGLCEGNVFQNLLLLILMVHHGRATLRIRYDCLASHSSHNVTALHRGCILSLIVTSTELFLHLGNLLIILICFSAGLLNELHASHFELLDGSHVNFGHVVLLVAWIDILCDSLGFLHDEVRSLILGHVTVNSAWWLLEAIISDHDLMFQVLRLHITVNCIHCLQKGCLGVSWAVWHLHKSLLHFLWSKRRDKGRGSSCSLRLKSMAWFFFSDWTRRSHRSMMDFCFHNTCASKTGDCVLALLKTFYRRNIVKL